MQLKNLFTGATLTLPDDLLWSDEHAWSPVVSSVSYLITGSLLVQSATRKAGRAITLVGAADMAWVTRKVVNVLRDWAALPPDGVSGRFELTLQDSRLFKVAFRHGDGALEAEPVTGFPARSDFDFYRITLKLMQI
jgi:hypothetical protein